MKTGQEQSHSPMITRTAAAANPMSGLTAKRYLSGDSNPTPCTQSDSAFQTLATNAVRRIDSRSAVNPVEPRSSTDEVTTQVTGLTRRFGQSYKFIDRTSVRSISERGQAWDRASWRHLIRCETLFSVCQRAFRVHHSGSPNSLQDFSRAILFPPVRSEFALVQTCQ